MKKFNFSFIVVMGILLVLMGSAPATRDRYQLSLEDVLFGSTQLKLDVIASRQYVHRAFSEMDWNMVGNDQSVDPVEPGTRFFLNGKMIGGTGSGGDGQFADEEQFDGPTHADRYSMAFNNVGLMTETAETRLYRMNWVFNAAPKLRFAFTPDDQKEQTARIPGRSQFRLLRYFSNDALSNAHFYFCILSS